MQLNKNVSLFNKKIKVLKTFDGYGLMNGDLLLKTLVYVRH